MKVIIPVLFYWSLISAAQSEYQFDGQLKVINKNVSLNNGSHIMCQVVKAKSAKRGIIETGAKEIFTPTMGHDEYRYFPVTEIGLPYKGCFSFKVNTAKEVKVSLSNQAEYADPKLFFMLGGWGNTESAISQNNKVVVKVPTPNLFKVGEFRSLWIKWDNGKVEVGRKGETVPILQHYDSLLYPINFVGILTCCGANGYWIFEESNCPGYNATEKEFEVKCTKSQFRLTSSEIAPH